MNFRPWGIRVATALVVLFAGHEAFTAPTPKTLPDYALGNLWILRGERTLGILVLLIIVVTIVWRGIVEGQLPLEIGREGLKYEAAKDLIAAGTQPVTEAVDQAVQALRSDLAKVSDAVDATAGATAEAIRQIEGKIEKLENELRQ